jgi:acyl carrier protein
LTPAADFGLMDRWPPGAIIPREQGMYMEEVESVVLCALAAKTGRRPKLSDDLARMSIDSLAMAEIALEIEEKLQVKLTEGILDQPTVGDLVRHIAVLRRQQSPAT